MLLTGATGVTGLINTPLMTHSSFDTGVKKCWSGKLTVEMVQQSLHLVWRMFERLHFKASLRYLVLEVGGKMDLDHVWIPSTLEFAEVVLHSLSRPAPADDVVIFVCGPQGFNESLCRPMLQKLGYLHVATWLSFLISQQTGTNYCNC